MNNVVILLFVVVLVIATGIVYSRLNDSKKAEEDMARKQGLETYDENGKTIVSVTNRLTKILGEAETFISKDNPYKGFIAVPEVDDGKLWYIPVATFPGKVVGGGGRYFYKSATPVVYQVPGGIAWEFDEDTNDLINIKFIYGIY